MTDLSFIIQKQTPLFPEVFLTPSSTSFDIEKAAVLSYYLDDIQLFDLISLLTICLLQLSIILSLTLNLVPSCISHFTSSLATHCTSLTFQCHVLLLQRLLFFHFVLLTYYLLFYYFTKCYISLWQAFLELVRYNINKIFALSNNFETCVLSPATHYFCHTC